MKLFRLIVRRLGLGAVLIVGITFLTFLLSHVVPGDPVASLLGERGTEEQITRMRHELGLDKSLPVQYGKYLVALAHLDLGRSIRSRRPVSQDLAHYFPATLELSSVALGMALLVGVPLGLAAALNHDRAIDHACRLFALTGVSMPVFWLGLLLLILLYSQLNILPPGGRISDFVEPPPTITGLLTIDSILSGNWEALGSALWHLLLPAACLGYGTAATLARMVRSQMLEVLSQDFVRTGFALGLPRHQILYRYALKNALLPVVTVLGLAYGGLLSGAVLTETIFSWPGLVKYAVGAVVNLDFPALMGVTLVIATIYSVINLLVDLAYMGLDPRLSVSE